MKNKQVLLMEAAKRMRDRKMKGGTLQNKTGNQSKQSITKQEVANTSINSCCFFACRSIKAPVWVLRSFISPTFVPLPPESVFEPCRLWLVCSKCRPTTRPLHWFCASAKVSLNILSVGDVELCGRNILKRCLSFLCFSRWNQRRDKTQAAVHVHL